MKLTDTAIEIAKKVELLILDVDGVLTDGGIILTILAMIKGLIR